MAAAIICAAIAGLSAILESRCRDIFRETGIGVADPPIYSCPAEIPKEVFELAAFSFSICAALFLLLTIRNRLAS